MGRGVAASAIIAIARAEKKNLITFMLSLEKGEGFTKAKIGSC
jgi:hypothetical protein